MNLLARTPTIVSQVAAFVAGSGAFYDKTFPSGSPESEPPRPKGTSARPFIGIHGAADPNVPYGGREDKDDDKIYRLPDIKSFLASWAARNCDSASSSALPSPTKTTKPFDKVTLRTWECPDEADVLGYEVEGMEHTWPRGDTEAMDATFDVCLPFFEKHVLRN